VLNNLPRKTSLTILSFGVFALAIVLVNRWIATPPPVVKKAAPPAQANAVPFLDVPKGSLDAFFASLRRTEARAPGAVTRILHYGDSPTTADSITADVRKLLQARFGDAGHGFVLIAKPWAWYGHRGIKLSGTGWHIEPASQARAKDGIHGLGGVSFTGQPGATSSITLPDDHYSRGTVYYLAQPDGGDFSIGTAQDEGEDAKITDVQTAGDEKKPGFAEFAVPPGARTLNLRVTSGKVRLFGYRFDKDQPGVQYSSLGINGAQVQMVVRAFEVTQWTEFLRHENPALVVLNYGTNESIYPRYVEQQYPDELRHVIATIRKAVPNASLLLMGPMDRGIANAGGDVTTPPSLESLIAVQKQVAGETGCAFFNTFEAMGGAGTMARWYNAHPQLVSADYMHPMPAGAAIVGELFEKALLAAYAQVAPQ
jgi:lysophospholipase L1-like esterase